MMNILYLHSHDTGRYIQPYGYDLPSPNLDSLAREGVLFRKAFTVSPTCSPSRAALLTGTYPHQNGVIGLTHRGFTLRDPREHLVSFLKEQGFHTALAGIQHEASEKGLLGYDEVLVSHLDYPDASNMPANVVAERAVEFLRRPRSKPFFLAAGFFETHRQFPDPGEDWDNGCRLRPPEIFSDTAENRADMAGYAESLRRFDHAVGRILAALEESGAAEETLVICTTDHGLAFPEMKCNATEHGTGVFLILRGPGGFCGGKVIDALMTHLDVFPTLCDLLRVSAPERLEGRSLLPLIEGKTDRLHDAVFGEVNFHAAYEPQRTVRTERFRYVRRYAEQPTPCLANIDACPEKVTLCRQGFSRRPIEEERLFDLAFDPMERHNVARDPAYAGALQEMRRLLREWMERTGDPLLRGPISPPPGARLAAPGDWASSQPEMPASLLSAMEADGG